MQKTFLQTKTATSVVACTRYDHFFSFSAHKREHIFWTRFDLTLSSGGESLAAWRDFAGLLRPNQRFSLMNV